MFKLFDVLRHGDSGAIEQAVHDSTSDKNALTGTTILHLAVQCAQPSVVEQVIGITSRVSGAKTDLNVQDKDGNTPLHLAASLGRPQLVRVLLEQKTADSSMLNYQGRTALDLAKTPEIFQQLQYDRAMFLEQQVRRVQELVAKKNYDGLEKILEDTRVTSVLDVNGAELAAEPSTVESGGSLLHEAARRRDTKLIQLLLLHGADPFHRDRKGKLPQDVTKDDRTRAILKRSPAATAAQRGIQEKAILGGTGPDSKPGGKDSREMKGYLKKWTNYTGGYKLRWFVLEDGVLSYYKHQDDAGSACRGAMNMRIAQLSMDSQEKTRFEIHGKSSVKYHLRANHTVEAKRWFWALNNAIQWAKDEMKEEQRAAKESEAQRLGLGAERSRESTSFEIGSRSLAPSISLGPPSGLQSSTSLQAGLRPGGSVAGDEPPGSVYDSQEPSVVNEQRPGKFNADDVDGTHDDDVSSRDLQPAPKDAFNITAHSASLQLDLLSQVSAALRTKAQTKPETALNEDDVTSALMTYEGAVSSLKGMVNDLLKIARDRDAYWQYRLDREGDLRRLWEESMAKVAKEQEELEGRMGQSEEKRKLAKRALKQALEDSTYSAPAEDHEAAADEPSSAQATHESPRYRRQSIGSPEMMKRSAIAALDEMSESGSDDEEFFDAVGAGEIPVEPMPHTPLPDDVPALKVEPPTREQDSKMSQIEPSYKGYEDPVRKRLKLDADERPKISLWVSCLTKWWSALLISDRVY
jgi:oxysterol-binding protein 1